MTKICSTSIWLLIYLTCKIIQSRILMNLSSSAVEWQLVLLLKTTHQFILLLSFHPEFTKTSLNIRSDAKSSEKRDSAREKIRSWNICWPEIYLS